MVDATGHITAEVGTVSSQTMEVQQKKTAVSLAATYSAIYDIFLLSGIADGVKTGIKYTTSNRPSKIKISERHLEAITIGATENKIILVGNEILTVYREL